MTTQPGAVPNRGGRLSPPAVRRSPAAPTLLTVAVSLITVLVSLLPAARADAAPWPTAATQTTGTLQMATLDAYFVPQNVTGLSGVTGGDTLVAGNVALGTAVMVDLRNRGTVPVKLSGQLTSGGLVSTNFSVEVCNLPWVGETCPTGGGVRMIVGGALPVVGQSKPVDYTNGTPLPVGGVLYLKLVFGGVALSNATLTCVEAAIRLPVNRTLS